MATSIELAVWLKTLTGVHSVTPGVLTIGKQVYAAARYFRTLPITAGCAAYANGEREYTQEFIYAIGMLPQSYCRSTHVAYTTPAGMHEWYVCCYAGLVVKRMQEIAPIDAYHPHGNMFILSPWSVDGAIDQYERTPYRREAIDFAEVA